MNGGLWMIGKIRKTRDKVICRVLDLAHPFLLWGELERGALRRMLTAYRVTLRVHL